VRPGEYRQAARVITAKMKKGRLAAALNYAAIENYSPILSAILAARRTTILAGARAAREWRRPNGKLGTFRFRAAVA
jgi:hypothetical protein